MRTTLCLLLLAALAGPIPAEGDAEGRTVNNGNVGLQGVPEVPEELRARLARYQNTRSAGFQEWARDGEGLYVTTRFGNTSQVHHVAAPGAARRQITFFDEPVRGIERRPGGLRADLPQG